MRPPLKQHDPDPVQAREARRKAQRSPEQAPCPVSLPGAAAFSGGMPQDAAHAALLHRAAGSPSQLRQAQYVLQRRYGNSYTAHIAGLAAQPDALVTASGAGLAAHSGTPTLAPLGGGIVARQASPATVALRAEQGAISRDFLEDLGEWGARIYVIATNPVGALAGGLWRALPDRFKPPLINTIVDAADAILDHMRGIVSVTLGPLWVVVREFLLGFLRHMRRVPETLKIALSNRLADLMSGGSLTFILHLFKGLGLAVWDVVRMPYDLIVGITEGVRLVARFIGNLTRDDLAMAYDLLATGLDAAWNGVAGMVREPRRALQFFLAIWESIQSAAAGLGRFAANALLDFFQLPDARLGEELGRFAGGFLVDVLIGVFTAGAGALLRRAASVAGQLATMLRRALRVGREILQLIHAVVEPLLSGLRRVGELFQHTTFGGWLGRLHAWLERMLGAAGQLLSNTAGTVVRGGRHAYHVVSETVQQLMRRVRAMAERIFDGLGFRGFTAELHGEWLIVYGLRSKHELIRAHIIKGSRVDVPQDSRLAAKLRRARERWLKQAANTANKAKANRLRGQAARNSETIGERAAHAARHHLPSPPRRRIYRGSNSGKFDLVYELEDGTIAIVEAKGGRGRIGTRRVRRGVRSKGRPAAQGSRAYIREILVEMSRGSSAERRAAAEIQQALEQGRLRYFLSKTPIPSGNAPLTTTLSEFRRP